MKKFKNINDILDFAIRDEQRASDLYNDLAKKAKSKGMREVFEQFSREELGHKKKLEVIKASKTAMFSKEVVQDLKIGDYLIEVDKSRDDLSYQDALIIAMKEEKAAFRLYLNLSNQTDDAELKQVFLMLAQEEAKHKLRFEIEYDNNILKDN